MWCGQVEPGEVLWTFEHGAFEGRLASSEKSLAFPLQHAPCLDRSACAYQDWHCPIIYLTEYKCLRPLINVCIYCRGVVAKVGTVNAKFRIWRVPVHISQISQEDNSSRKAYLRRRRGRDTRSGERCLVSQDSARSAADQDAVYDHLTKTRRQICAKRRREKFIKPQRRTCTTSSTSHPFRRRYAAGLSGKVLRNSQPEMHYANPRLNTRSNAEGPCARVVQPALHRWLPICALFFYS